MAKQNPISVESRLDQCKDFEIQPLIMSTGDTIQAVNWADEDVSKLGLGQILGRRSINASHARVYCHARWPRCMHRWYYWGYSLSELSNTVVSYTLFTIALQIDRAFYF